MYSYLTSGMVLNDNDANIIHYEREYNMINCIQCNEDCLLIVEGAQIFMEVSKIACYPAREMCESVLHRSYLGSI